MKSKSQRMLEDITRTLEQHARIDIESHEAFVKMQNNRDEKHG